MNKLDKTFLTWMVSVGLCFLIEYSLQEIGGIIGIGIISAIFLSITFLPDFIYAKDAKQKTGE